jgi:hypothetical protein
MQMLALLTFVSLLVGILSQPLFAKPLRGLWRNRKELALFAAFFLVEGALVAIVLAAVGPRVAFYVIIGSVALFAIWAMKPPAKRR